MAIRFADVDKVNAVFSKKKINKSLTEEAVRAMISEKTISILEQNHISKRKGEEKKTSVSKVLKKYGDNWYLRLYYGVAVVCGAEIEAADEKQAIKEAVDYCKDIAKGKCDDKTKALIKKAFEDKVRSLADARETRARNKKAK
jgi:hypothetical protein